MHGEFAPLQIPKLSMQALIIYLPRAQRINGKETKALRLGCITLHELSQCLL